MFLVVLECWPYFSVAGDQHGCDFNSVEIDGIRNSKPIEFDRFKNPKSGELEITGNKKPLLRSGFNEQLKRAEVSINANS